MEQLQDLAKKYKIVKSEMYNITTYIDEKQETTIIDYGDTISLKKSTRMTQEISDMLDIAQMKGWDLEKMEIRGDEKFIEESKKQIRKRLQSHAITTKQILPLSPKAKVSIGSSQNTSLCPIQ